MNEPLDAILRRRIRESGAKELQDWEFTSAMQQQVLERLAREGESGAEERPHRAARRIARPLVWVAAAAAAVVLAISGDWGSLRNPLQKQDAAEESASSAPAATSAPLRTMKSSAQEDVMQSAGAAPHDAAKSSAPPESQQRADQDDNLRVSPAAAPAEPPEEQKAFRVMDTGDVSITSVQEEMKMKGNYAAQSVDDARSPCQTLPSAFACFGPDR